jgi:hypothetical protein
MIKNRHRGGAWKSGKSYERWLHNPFNSLAKNKKSTREAIAALPAAEKAKKKYKRRKRWARGYSK